MGSTLHADLLLADDGGMKDVATYDPRSTPWMKWLESDNQAAQVRASCCELRASCCETRASCSCESSTETRVHILW